MRALFCEFFAHCERKWLFIFFGEVDCCDNEAAENIARTRIMCVCGDKLDKFKI